MQGESMGFSRRHIGASAKDLSSMLEVLEFSSLEEMVKAIVPQDILLERPIDVPEALTETEALAELEKIAKKNKPIRSLIGQGYYASITPPVILRNILENPAWYTAYTPYQPEISQGRLEALLNFQTMICDLTGMEIANASLLDEATAAAEAMMLARRQSKSNSKVFLVDPCVHPQTIDVLISRAEFQDIEIVVHDGNELGLDKSFAQILKETECFGVLLQSPSNRGVVHDLKHIVSSVQSDDVVVCVATDLLALTLFTPPGECGADIVIGSTQHFGVPMGFGGPHAAFMATRDSFKRAMPGRLVGVSKDSRGKSAYRLALQTREQHIRREKATSNVCTAQALLAIMASSYAVYHGPEGLKAIAEKIYDLTARIAAGMQEAGFCRYGGVFFNTLTYQFANKESAAEVIQRALAAGYNLRRPDCRSVSFSLDERSTLEEAEALLRILTNNPQAILPEKGMPIPAEHLRSSPYLTHPVFNRYHSETEMMRYLRRLSDMDLALDRTMIPLGSCTMKLNAAAEMQGISWPAFADIHPFAPTEQTEGYQQLLSELASLLCAITGYSAFSLQPNSGAQGEYAGLLAIRAYHASRGEAERDICLIPSSAHGTNPASAALAGLRVVIVACDNKGNIDLEDLAQKIAQHRDKLAAIMITYPSTHGVFERPIRKICEMVHEAGGQVYLDGANMNAQVGLAAPALYGSDVSHLNLHKTFAIPHGGGGPGSGPIGVREHLVPFLPGHAVVAKVGGGLPVSAAPYGSALIAVISWMYIRMMGAKGLRDASVYALLNANYIAKRLEGAYPVLYTDENGYVAHECIIDVRGFKDSAGVSVEDIAKRLMDYGFHAPTMSFPVAGTLMIEPTESESKAELDRFCEAMLAIREEIARIERGEWPKEDNPLVNAPHTLADITSNWQRAYTREEAIFPVKEMNPAKYFTPVNRIDNAYGDRYVFCSCPPIEAD